MFVMWMASLAVGSDDLFCHNGHQLPSFFLLGAQKCGTTSLASQLFDQVGFARGSATYDGAP